MANERKETVSLFPIHQYEMLTSDLPPADHALAALQDRQVLHCLGKLHLWCGMVDGSWVYRVARELPNGSDDLRDQPSQRLSVLSIRQQLENPNVAYVEDFTNDALEGCGVNQWLIHRARQAFLEVSGPDPWLSGRLVHNDRHNPRRVPFWERQVGAAVYVDDAGNGHFMVPWNDAFNRYRMKVAVVPSHQQGKVPVAGNQELIRASLAGTMAVMPSCAQEHPQAATGGHNLISAQIDDA